MLTLSGLASRFFRNRAIDATVEINGERESVAVEADYQSPDDDPGIGEGVEITAVWYEDQGNIIDSIAPDALAELEDEILEKFYGYCEYHLSGGA